MALLSNGDRPTLRLTLPALGAISSIAGVIIFCGGWVFGYTTFKADLAVVTENVINLRNENRSMQERINASSQSIVDDRQALSSRLTALEVESKYISQGIAELKIAIVPKH